MTDKDSIEDISYVIGSKPLAEAIQESVTEALIATFVRLQSGTTVWDVFDQALQSAIRDIENHRKGILFRRLLEYGPVAPDDSEQAPLDGKTILSDEECIECVRFVFSFMVNQFKGALAELLSIKPALQLLLSLQQKKALPAGIEVHFGNTIKEQRRLRSKNQVLKWGGYMKGADGLFVERMSNKDNQTEEVLIIHAIMEVKSMRISDSEILSQIEKHAARLTGGLQLCGVEYSTRFDDHQLISSKGDFGFPVTKIMVVPSNRRLSRDWKSVKADQGRGLEAPPPSRPEEETTFEELERNCWKITLSWSQEDLEQAAYEMTTWYMTNVGASIWTGKVMPKGWEEMSPQKAGFESIKMMLYYMQLRNLGERDNNLATKLYNIYAFGYPLGVDGEEMLWPDAFPPEDEQLNKKE